MSLDPGTDGRLTVVADPLLGESVAIVATFRAQLPQVATALVTAVVSAGILINVANGDLGAIRILCAADLVLVLGFGVTLVQAYLSPIRVVIGTAGFRAWPWPDVIWWHEVRDVELLFRGRGPFRPANALRILPADPPAFYARRGRLVPKLAPYVPVSLRGTRVSAADARSLMQASLDAYRQRSATEQGVAAQTDTLPGGPELAAGAPAMAAASWPGRRSVPRRAKVIAGVVVVVAAAAIVAINLGPREPLVVTGSTVLAPDSGHVIFSDDFHASSSGWATGTRTSGATFAYGTGGYTIRGVAGYLDVAPSPFTELHDQLSVSVTGIAANTGDAEAGLGVMCAIGASAFSSSSSGLAFDFVQRTTGVWQVIKVLGRTPSLVTEGTVGSLDSTQPHTVLAMCATLADRRSVRLLLFVDGTKEADTMVSVGQATDTGWRGGIVLANGTYVATMTATDFVERDLAR